MKQDIFVLICAFSLLLSPFVNPEAAPESRNGCGQAGAEIVTTIPVETDLKGAGTRRAARVWPEMVNRAVRTLDFSQFYLITEKNEPLEPVLMALKKAAERGVKIRFLTDKKMMNTSRPLVERLRKITGVEIRIFDWGKLTGGINHSKYFIADDREAFVGSQNFDWRALKHIHETGVRISDSGVVGNLKRIFEADWRYSGGDEGAYQYPDGEPEALQSRKMILTASPAELNPPGVGSTLEMIKTLLRGAEKRVSIQLLNYKTEIYHSKKEFLELYELLKKTAGRGVEVRMAVSDWNLEKPGVDSIKALARIKGISVKVFAIPEFSGGFIPYARVIHSKVLRVDEDLSMISTSNWGHGYFYVSRNVEVTIKHKQIAGILDELFNELWNSRYGTLLDPGKDYIPRRRH